MKNILVILALFVLFFGCVTPNQPPEPGTNKTTTNNNESVKLPNFVITSPQNGAVIKTTENSADIEIVLSATNLVLKPLYGGAKMGEGHFHLYLDNTKDPVMISEKAYTLKDVALGEHTLKVELVHNDHKSYSPKIVKTAIFTIEKEKNGLTTYEVMIEDYAYNPAVLTINIKDNVKWTNTGTFPRSVTATDQSFNTVLNPGESYMHKFTAAGTYEYNSANWPQMKGTIIVEEK